MKPVFSFFIMFLLLFPLTHNLTQANQQTNIQEPEKALQLKANLIEVRAVVTDKKGNLIEGLTKDKFEILEEGKLQELAFFSAERIAATSSPENNAIDRNSTSTRQPKTVARTIVFFIDSLNLSLSSVARLKSMLKRFIDEQITDQDVVAIVNTSGTLGLLQQFTTNKPILKQAIERLRSHLSVRESLFTPFLSAMVLRRDRTAIDVARQIYQAEEGQLPPEFPLEDNRIPRPPPLVEAKAITTLVEAAAKRRTTLNYLQAITDRMAELPGQRLVVMVSDGFTLMSEEGDFQPEEVQKVIGCAGRSGVVIYAIDGKGLEPDAVFRADIKVSALNSGITSYMRSSSDDLRNGMSALANDTGGKFFRNSNDFSVGLKQVIADNRIYYALAYYPTNEKEDDKFRRLTVRVKGHPEYEVRTQKGFSPLEFAKKEKDESALTPQQRLTKAITAPLPSGDMDVTVAADYLETDDANTQLLLQTSIDGNTLQFQQQGERQSFNLELVTFIYDFKGKVAASSVEKIEGKLNAARFAQMQQYGLRHIKRFALKPGLYQVRQGLREIATERIATAFGWVEIPELKHGKWAMSGVQTFEGNASTAKPVTANAAKNDDLYHPKVRRGIPIFKRANMLAYSLLLYNALAAASAELQTEIYNGETVVYQSGWQAVDTRIIEAAKKGKLLGGQFKLDLPPGVYELRCTVKDAKDKKRQTEIQRSTLFEVE